MIVVFIKIPIYYYFFNDHFNILRLPELGNAASGDAEQNEDDEYDPAEEPVTQLR